MIKSGIAINVFKNGDLVFSHLVNTKYKLAKAYIKWTRNHEANDLATKEREEWKNLIEKINKVLE